MIFPDLRALDTHIKAGALLPVYLLYGEENRQIEAARDRLVKTIVPEEALPPVPVELGTQSTVQPVLGEGNVLLLEKARAGDLTQTVELVDSAAAPVEAGDRLGTLTVTAGEETAAEIPILAGETVPRITFSQMLLRLLRTAFLAG
mgnify:CR=1 FL=1